MHQVQQIGRLLGKSRRCRAASLKLAAPPVERQAAIAILGKEGLLAKLTKAVVERALGAELTHHLGYARGGAPEAQGNCRNGTSAKTLIGEGGK